MQFGALLQSLGLDHDQAMIFISGLYPKFKSETGVIGIGKDPMQILEARTATMKEAFEKERGKTMTDTDLVLINKYCLDMLKLLDFGIKNSWFGLAKEVIDAKIAQGASLDDLELFINQKFDQLSVQLANQTKVKPFALQQKFYAPKALMLEAFRHGFLENTRQTFAKNPAIESPLSYALRASVSKAYGQTPFTQQRSSTSRSRI